MAICSVPSCHSSSTKGFRMFRFPVNAQKRQIWIKNCNQPNWNPTSNQKICELHFDENQFEKNRRDHWSKLKFNAVPTKFDECALRKSTSKLSKNKSKSASKRTRVNILRKVTRKKENTNVHAEVLGKDEPGTGNKSIVPPQYCRTCACSDEPFTSLFATDTHGKALHTIIEKHLPIKVQKGDKLPLQVCRKCCETLKAWDTLFDDVFNAEKRLIEISSQDKHEELQLDTGMDSDNDSLIDILTTTNDEPTNDQSGSMFNEPLVKQRNKYRRTIDKQVSNKMRMYSEDDFGLDEEENEDDPSEETHAEEIRLRRTNSAPPKDSAKKSTESPTETDLARLAIPVGWLQTLTCDVCDKIGQPAHESDGQELKFSCGQCNKAFATQTNYMRHLRVHKKQTSGENQYGCRNCLRKYKFESYALEHEKLCGVFEFFPCSACGRRFSTKEEADTHAYSHHLSCVCELCGIDFENSQKFKWHMKAVHQSNRSVCHYCGKSFTRKQRLLEHFQKHTGQMDFTCVTCGKGCTNSYSFSVHLATHSTNKPFKCSLCPRTFKHLKYRYLHERAVHLEAKPKSKKPAKNAAIRTCPDCDKVFRRESALLIHRRSVHEGLNGYICKICNKDFKYSYMLYVHKKKQHYPQRCKYKCSYCDKPFPVKTELQKHLLKHTGEKPYVCGECGKKYAFKGSLNAHRKSHHPKLPAISTRNKESVCSLCDVSFTYKSQLLRHMTVHADRLKPENI